MVSHLCREHLAVVLDFLLLFLVGAPVVLGGTCAAGAGHLVGQLLDGGGQVLVRFGQPLHQRVHLPGVAVRGEQAEGHRVQNVPHPVEKRAADLREQFTGKDVLQDTVHRTEHGIKNTAYQRTDSFLQHVKDGKHRRDDLPDDAAV